MLKFDLSTALVWHCHGLHVDYKSQLKLAKADGRLRNVMTPMASLRHCQRMAVGAHSDVMTVPWKPTTRAMARTAMTRHENMKYCTPIHLVETPY